MPTGIDGTTDLIGSSRGWKRNEMTPMSGMTAQIACSLDTQVRSELRLGQAWNSLHTNGRIAMELYCQIGGRDDAGRQNFEQWELGDAKDAAALMNPAVGNVLQKWPVSKRMNSSRAPDDDPTLIDRLKEVSGTALARAKA